MAGAVLADGGLFASDVILVLSVFGGCLAGVSENVGTKGVLPEPGVEVETGGVGVGSTFIVFCLPQAAAKSSSRQIKPNFREIFFNIARCMYCNIALAKK